MCPNLVVVHVQTYKDGEIQPAYHPDPNNKTHKVSLDYYRRESLKIISILKETLVGAEIGRSIPTSCSTYHSYATREGFY
jgi:DNA polymerase eta